MDESKELVNRLKNGDKSAYREIFETYSGIVKTIAYRYLKSNDDAEDILQETFIIIFQKINQYKGQGSFEGWIRRITANYCLGVIKSKKKFYFEEINDDILTEKTHETKVNENDMDYLVKRCDFSKEDILEVIASLSQGYRIVFNMYVLEGFKHKEIAKALDISVSTSKTQLLRARKILQKKLYTLAIEKYLIDDNVLLKNMLSKEDDLNKKKKKKKKKKK